MASDFLLDVWGDKATTAVSGKTISTGVGDDLIEVLATSARGTATAIKKSTVNAGAGDDTITFKASTGAACTAHGMHSTTLDTGDGTNFVTVQASSQGGHALGAEGSTLRGGSGADSFIIKASTINSGTSVGLHSSTLDMKDGDNTLRIEALAVNCTATGMYNSKVFAGSGNDDIYVLGKTTGNGVARGLHYSSISAGDGNNTVSIYAEAAKSDAYAIACDVIGGKDQDIITVSATSLGGGIAKGLVCSTVDGKEGDNIITISASSATGHAYAIDGGKVRAGSGDDSVTISAVSGGGGRAQGLHCSDVNVGDGDNTVSIQAESKTGEAWGIGCEVTSGSGDDYISVGAKTSGTAAARAVYCSTVSVGDGDNHIDVTASSAGGRALGMESGKLIGGNGADEFIVKASTIGSGAATGQYGGLIDLKNGDNTLRIEANTVNGTATGSQCATINGGDYGFSGYSTEYGENVTLPGTERYTILANASGTGSAYGLNATTVNMKEGNNTLHIEAHTVNGTATGVLSGTLYGGSGSYVSIPSWGVSETTASTDRFTIIGQADGTGKAYGFNGCRIDMKDGLNYLDISALAASNDAYALKGATVYGGNDADVFNIFAKSGGSGTAKALDCSSIYAKDGFNQITIGAESAAGNAYGIACEVVGGKDNDIISVTAKSLGNGYANAMVSSKIDAKGGENTITIHAESATGKAYAVDGGGVYSGSGNDVITISAKSGGSGRAQALHCTTVNAGDGNNLVSISADSVGGAAYAVGCGVYTGSGDDTVTISAISRTSTAYGLYCSTASVGNGNNIASVSATSGNSYAIAMESSHLLGGSGRDDFSILAQAGHEGSGGGDAVAVHSSTVNAKDGANTVVAKAVTHAGNATAMWASNMHTGSGDDTISIIAQSDSGKATALDHSNVYAGDGNNQVTLAATSGSGNAYAIACDVIGGKGADLFSITAQAGGLGTAGGLMAGAINLKAGHNELTLAAYAADGAAYAAKSGVIYGGNDAYGEDIFSIKAHVTGAGSATGLDSGASVHLYGGHDDLTVYAHSDLNGNAWAVKGNIYAGEGNDTITAMATSNTSGALPSALVGGYIDGGLGNDDIHLITSGLLASGTTSQKSQVLGGAGNDVVHLVYDGSAADINFTQFKQNLTLDGGANSKVVHAASSGGVADLGDILSLEHGYADTALLSKLNSQATVKNFEALLLDFDNGASESISLGSMLDAMKSQFLKANTGMTSLIVKGDAGDVLDSGSLNAVEHHTGVEINGVSTDSLGNDITYTHYTVNYENQEFHVYLQTNVGLA